MEIVIGDASPVGSPATKDSITIGGMVEAKMLNIRPPRKRGRAHSKAWDNKRRQEKYGQDPGDGRIMVILVPDGYRIPKDIDTREYKILMRFIPKRG